ncbi:MAG: PrsW family glutamic-type intramembrane protease [Bacteroidales bacterium]
MRTFLAVLLVTVITGVVLNITIDNPRFSNIYEEISNAIKTDNQSLAEKLFLRELPNRKHDLDFNYRYVVNHFDIPEKTKVGKNSYSYRDDASIYDYYTQLSTSTDSVEHDLGFYCLGLCDYSKGEYIKATEDYRRVKNRSMKYLNNSVGNLFRKWEPEKAIPFYEKEIALNGNVGSAVHNLSSIYICARNLDCFAELLANEQTKGYVSLTKQREYYYLAGMYFGYAKTLWKKFVQSVDRYGFIGALLVALIWLFYLRFIDVFEREKWYDIAIVFTASAAFTYFSFPLYDMFNLSLGFDLNGNWLNDLFYCIFGIGLIEEIVKFIPFAIFLVFSKAVNEPIDYVIYACVAAIGFSFTENIIYFQEDSYHIMHGRALASVVGHMCDCSIVAYGFILCKYRSKSPMFVYVLVGLLLASIVHGLYDFWLINDTVKDFNILAMVVLVSSVIIWNSIKNNALNNSPFFDQSKKFESARISQFLFVALSVVFIFEYIIISLNYGPSVGNRLLLKSILSGTFLMIFMVGRLAQFKLRFGVWNRVKIWDSGK